jgi:molybdate transport system permease protein
VLSADEWGIVWLSLRVALFSVALLLPVGVALGWLLARREFHGKALLDGLVHLPLVLPPVVTGYLLLVLVGHRGLLGPALEALGMPVAFTWRAAVLAAMVMALPLMVRPVRLSIAQVDHALEDAARACGAGPWRVALRITIPLAAPGIIAGMVLAFARSMGEFGATITVAGSIPGVTRTLPSAVHALIDSPDGEAGAVRLTVLSILISLLSILAAARLTKHLSPERS